MHYNTKILKIARQTPLSINDAAYGYTVLSRLGFRDKDIIHMLCGLPMGLYYELGRELITSDLAC